MQAKIGRTFITIFTSSTSCTEHFSLLQPSLFPTALFRNLRLSDGDSTLFDSILLLPFSSSDKGLVAILAIALLELRGMQELVKDAIRTCRTNHSK